MSVTVNSFPAAHAFNSSRGWAMAIIALIHVGFFLLLASSMNFTFLPTSPQTTQVTFEETKQPPPPPSHPVETRMESVVFVPHVPVPPRIDPMEDTAPRVVTSDPRPVSGPPTSRPERPAPVEIEPQIDPRRGLSEPVYPASLIRDNVEGLVVLSVQILENGRVGEVRIERSSGYSKMDESALREAKRWRLIPGTRDGVPVVLWKQIPIRFRLQG